MHLIFTIDYYATSRGKEERKQSYKKIFLSQSDCHVNIKKH